MTLDTTIGDAQTLAATHRTMWALGDYALMAEEVMAPLGPVLVAATGIGPGVRVLDVAAGRAISRFPPPRQAPLSFPPTSHPSCCSGPERGPRSGG
jgi:hypothetical protein